MLSVEHIRATVAIRLGTWGGIAGPIGFTLAWLGLGAAWPDYDPRTHYISELAASDAPHGVAMVAAFVALGVLMLVFARMLLWALGTGAAARGGAMLIYLFGGTSIASGLARCDPGCGGSSLTNQAHTLSTHIGLGALVLATLLLPWATRPDWRWRTFNLYSWLTGLLATAIFALDFATFGGVGTGQRLFVSLLFLWLVRWHGASSDSARSNRSPLASPWSANSSTWARGSRVACATIPPKIPRTRSHISR